MRYRFRFKGWQDISNKDAYMVARNLFKTITTSKNCNHLLKMINDKFDGISFDLNDLK